MSANEARGFLEVILAHPDDDAPRLVFADWLDEQGDSDRAEFIRVQIERARLPAWHARQVGLRLRERALLERHGKKWKGELPSLEGIIWEEFRRGFVASVAVSRTAALKASLNACWAAAPIEALFMHRPHSLQGLENLAPIHELRELFIATRFVDSDEIGRFADAPLLATLRKLTTYENNMGVEGFSRLVASPHLGNLQALRALRNSIGNAGITALLDADSLMSLEELDLSERDNYGRYGEDPMIEAAGIEALTTWPGMNRLRSLNLSGNAIGRHGLRTLLSSPRSSGLKELYLRDNGFNGSGMREFAAARAELQLDVLDLGENYLRDEGAVELAELTEPSCLRELKVLELDRCEIHFPGACRLAQASFLGSLRRLNVNHNSFGPEGLLAILEQKPPQLHVLKMADNDLGNGGALHLAESPASDTLLEVDLAANGLGDQAIQALANAHHLRNLLVLLLQDNQIDVSATATLAESPLGKRLAVLDVADKSPPF